ncbi:MAG: porin [Salinibacter sp.]
MDHLACFSTRCALLLGLLLLGGGAGQCVSAQSSPDGTVSVAGGGTLTVGGLLQADAYLGGPQGDRFRARSARVRLGGQIDQLQYVVQTDFSSPSVLLDAFARLPLTDRVRVTAGLFKTPFSGEFLTPRPDILFAERARAVNNVAPNRQAGVALGATLLPDRLSATVGAFNGTRGLRPNDNDLFLYVGRLDGQVPVGNGRLEVGTNVGYSIDDDVDLSGLNRPDFAGTRFLFGVDARLEIDRWFVAGEFDTAELDPRGPSIPGLSTSSAPFGFYLAGGANVAADHQLLARFDQFDPDVPTQAAPDDQLTLGYNYEPSSALRILLNYQTPLGEISDGFLTARLQVALR